MVETMTPEPPTPKTQPSSLKRLKAVGRSRLSLGSIPTKWPWNKSSPTALNTGSTFGTLDERKPDMNLSFMEAPDLPKHSIETGDLSPDAPDRVSARFVSRQNSADDISATIAVPNTPSKVAGGELSLAEIPDDKTIAMSDVDLAVAIDCSGSTEGIVLKEEVKAIFSMSDLLSQPAKDRVVVLPWNDGAESALSLNEVDELFSSGGTDPTALLRDRHHRQALQHSSLWALITDGEINDELVREFASGLGEAGLHGTASIVICVGRAMRLPIDCNISVGKAVFATVPDCLFLYHDIRTKEIYILQCKGRFRALLPDAGSAIVLDENTTWKDLPQLSYKALQDFAVPQKRKLSVDTVVLTSGNTFSLSDVYNDTLDISLTNEILSNDDDLKTLLMTASTRGRKDEVKRWISKKQLKTSDPVWAPRNDIEHRAFRCVEKLVYASKNSAGGDVSKLRNELRSAHERNWAAFTNSFIVETQQARTREIVIEDATARLILDDRKPSSPIMMGPVSPSISGPRYKHSSAPDYSPTVSHSSGKRKPRVESRMLPESALRSSKGPNVLFSRGYKCVKQPHGSKASERVYFEGTCTLCTRSGQAMALIFKKPEDEEPTANYPTVEQRAKHKYPFVLGNYPDVDIISPEIYCETCSVYLKRHGTALKSNSVVGALPLVQTHGSRYQSNLQSWRETLMGAFEGRFHEDIVLSVFLSVLYNTLDDLTAIDSSENTLLTRALRWTCCNLLESLMVCRDSNTIPLGESPGLDNISSCPLAEALPRFLKHAMNGHGPFLEYPLEGFLVLILAARDIDNENCERGSLRCIVWLRLIMHLTEQHYASMHTTGREQAKTVLSQLLHTKEPETDQKDSLVARKSPTPLASLEGTHLLATADLRTFQRLGTLFTYIGSKCDAALAVYLHYLLEYSSMCSDAAGCFALIRKETSLRKLFCGPDDVDPGKAADLIAKLDSSQKE